MLGTTFAVGIEQNAWRAFCQCRALAHALMAVLKSSVSFGYTFHCFRGLGLRVCRASKP